MSGISSIKAAINHIVEDVSVNNENIINGTNSDSNDVEEFNVSSNNNSIHEIISVGKIKEINTNSVEYESGLKIYVDADANTITGAFYDLNGTTISLTECISAYLKLTDGDLSKVLTGINSIIIDENNNYIKIMNSDQINITFDYSTLKIVSIEDLAKNTKYLYDEDGDIIGTEGNIINIFNKLNDANEQYGGNQMDFCDAVKLYDENEEVRNILYQKFPDASYEEKLLLLEKLGHVGCGYVAFVNSIFFAYQGKEEEFKKDFGFSMYTVDALGNIDFNYESLILNYFLYENLGKTIIFEDGSREELYTIDALCGNILGEIFYDNSLISLFIDYDSTGATGIRGYSEKFLRDEYGIEKNVTIKEFADDGGHLDKRRYEEIKKEYGDNASVIYISYGYDLYNFDPNSNKKGFIASLNGGGHAMSIVDFTASGNMIVSSWGEAYNLDISDQDYGYYAIIVIE